MAVSETPKALHSHSAEAARRPHPFRTTLAIGGLTVLATLGGVTAYSVSTQEAPKAAYGITIYQDGTTGAGVVYRIDETDMVQRSEAEFSSETRELGRFTCRGSVTNAVVVFNPDLATQAEAERFNAALPPICSTYGALSGQADQMVIASLVEAGIIGG